MRSILFVSCAAFALSAGGAMAQDSGDGTIEEVVVTAQKRSENLQA